MPVAGSKDALVSALEERILTGPGASAPELRAQAFANRDVPGPLAVLIDKLVDHSFQVTDADFAAALAGGLTEDQLFELVICAAAGASSRAYHAGLAALAEAAG